MQTVLFTGRKVIFPDTVKRFPDYKKVLIARYLISF